MTFNRRLTFSVAVCTALLAAAPGAQQDERWRALEAQIDRIYQASEYALPRFGPARWLGDGTAYTTVERGTGEAGGSDIVRYDAATGARSILISNTQLTPAGADRALTIADYVWSDDGSKLLIFTNTQKVWRQNTRGDYWVLNVKGGGLKQVGTSQPPASLMFAKFSPDATRVGYVRANNVYVERLDDGKVTQLTTDGSENIINGTSDWVYEEEFGVRDGFRFSPDGKSMVYWQFDQSGRRHLLAHQHHRLAVSRHHEDSVSEGRYDQFIRAGRRRQYRKAARRRGSRPRAIRETLTSRALAGSTRPPSRFSSLIVSRIATTF